VAQRASLLVASPRSRKHVGPVGAADRALWACAARMCPADCGPAGQSIGSKPRPRVTGLVRHVCAQRIVAQRANILVASPRPRKTRWPRRGRRPRVMGAGAARMCPADCGPAGQYIGSRPPPKKNTLAPAGPPTAHKQSIAPMFCYRYVAPALTTLARRCFATNMSPRWGFSGRHVPSGLWPSGPVYW
jgi:hypothetical protein